MKIYYQNINISYLKQMRVNFLSKEVLIPCRSWNLLENIKALIEKELVKPYNLIIFAVQILLLESEYTKRM